MTEGKGRLKTKRGGKFIALKSFIKSERPEGLKIQGCEIRSENYIACQTIFKGRSTKEESVYYND